MFDVDLHAHTRFFHQWAGEPTRYDPLGANLLALASRWRGLDGVALTNHDYYTDVGAISTTPLFIPGIEISTTEGHAIVVGPDPPSRTPPGELTPQAVVDLAHGADCAAIIPHPTGTAASTRAAPTSTRSRSAANTRGTPTRYTNSGRTSGSPLSRAATLTSR